MNKFLSLFLLLSIGCLSAMNPNTEPRLRQREQFEYFRAISDLFESGDLAAVQERVSFFRSIQSLGRWFYISADQLDSFEVQLVEAQRAQDEASLYLVRQFELQEEYKRAERDVFCLRDEEDIDAERTALIQLWRFGRELEKKPATWTAHMIRLLQVEECNMAFESNLALKIDVQTDIERYGDSIAQYIKDMMLYGVEGQSRCTSPFQRLFDEAKRIYGSDHARSFGLLEFLCVVGSESLRTQAEIFMACGDEYSEENSQIDELAEELPMAHILVCSVIEREEAYLAVTEGDLQIASVLAEQNGDHEVVGRLAQQIADEADACQFIDAE